jgi:4-carboxymuconolactone decarboxylase
MTSISQTESAYSTLDAPTAQLVDLAAVLAAGTEGEMRATLENAAKSAIDPHWVEELVLQTYLFAGFPRTLNGMRLWRRASNRVAETADFEEWLGALWTSRGEQTCEQVYGNLYKRLRANIRSLHPALDTWMIDLYGECWGDRGWISSGGSCASWPHARRSSRIGSFIRICTVRSMRALLRVRWTTRCG